MRAALSLLAALFLIDRAPGADVAVNPDRHPSAGFAGRAAPDGKTVVTIGSDRCVRVWEAASGKLLRSLWLPQKTGGMYQPLKFWLSPDGKTLALPFHTDTEPRGKLALIPLNDSGTYRVIGGDAFEVEHVAFSPDGKRIATASPWPVNVREVATGKLVCAIEYDKDLRASGLAFTPDGSKLTVTLPLAGFNELKRSSVITFDATTGKPLVEAQHADKFKFDMARPVWSPDGKTLAFVREHQTVELRDADGKLRMGFGPPKSELIPPHPEDVAFDVKGRLLVAWRDGAEFVIRDELAGKQLIRLKPADGRQFTGASFTLHGHLLISDERFFAVHDLTSGASREVCAAESMPTAVGWAKGPVLAWGFGPSSHPKDGSLSAALDLGQLKAVPLVGAEFTRRRTEWDGVKLTDDGYRAKATANGKTVALVYEPEMDCQDIKWTTLVGPGHAVLSTGAGMFSYDTKTGERVAAYGTGWTLAASPDGKFFAATDWQVPLIRVYRPTAPDPVLTVYAVGSEWVAWTPGGAWASSERAGKWVGTLTDPEPGKLPVFVPFDPKFRDPDKVKAVLK